MLSGAAGWLPASDVVGVACSVGWFVGCVVGDGGVIVCVVDNCLCFLLPRSGCVC